MDQFGSQDHALDPTQSLAGYFRLMMLIVPSHALQQQPPFARHFYDSPAATADRDIGSGDGSCYVPELFGDQPFWPELPGDSVLGLTFLPAGTVRYGEANHAGPDRGDLLTGGVSNPCGLRHKEDQLLQLGPVFG